jgi:hypothetical protein
MVVPYNESYFLRIEPDNCFTVIHRKELRSGNAWMIPSIRDTDGTLAYQYRKYINAWLTR